MDPALPTFVPRTEAKIENRVRTWMRTARHDGGMLLLVGDSSVGKTRLLYETARTELGDFALLAPGLGDGELVNAVAELTTDAEADLPPLLVWLDELQRFLSGPYLTPGSTPITPTAARRLLDADTPVIIVGTLWPSYAAELRATDPAHTDGSPRPRHPDAADILTDPRRHEFTLDTFSEAERAAAATAAATDPRLAQALAVRDFNVTETLAGAPQLIRRYDQARGAAQAVLHAAIDIRRLGMLDRIVPAVDIEGERLPAPPAANHSSSAETGDAGPASTATTRLSASPYPTGERL